MDFPYNICCFLWQSCVISWKNASKEIFPEDIDHNRHVCLENCKLNGQMSLGYILLLWLQSHSCHHFLVLFSHYVKFKAWVLTWFDSEMMFCAMCQTAITWKWGPRLFTNVGIQCTKAIGGAPQLSSTGPTLFSKWLRFASTSGGWWRANHFRGRHGNVR